MYKSHLKARRGASQGGTPLAEIDSTSVESAWSVTPSTGGCLILTSTGRLEDPSLSANAAPMIIVHEMWQGTEHRATPHLPGPLVNRHGVHMGAPIRGCQSARARWLVRPPRRRGAHSHPTAERRLHPHDQLPPRCQHP